MIRTRGLVFLGVVVNPKTWEPIFVLRNEYTTLSVSIFKFSQSQGAYLKIGGGYLETADGNPQYTAASVVTGYPRAHTPAGVSEQGGGYGTCLYTGLVLLASALAEGALEAQNVSGERKAGICSSTGYNSRSAAAERWWRAALERGMTVQEEGVAEAGEGSDEETETIEDESLSDYFSQRTMTLITSKIRELANDATEDWYVTAVEDIKVALERTIPGEETEDIEVTADIFSLKSAYAFDLVAIRHEHVGDIMSWARAVVPSVDEEWEVNYKVILGLNVAEQDPMVVGQLALVARNNGASDAQVTRMLMRNRFGYDTARAPMHPDVAGGAISATQRRRDRSGVPEVVVPNPSPSRLPGFRRNPPSPPTPAERRQLHEASDELEQIRKSLRWGEIADLP